MNYFLSALFCVIGYEIIKFSSFIKNFTIILKLSKKIIYILLSRKISDHWKEKILLSVRPGITDFSSIVFSDEGEILKDSKNPDLDYNQLIRPWKSRLGILYVQNRSMFLDIKLIIITAIAIVSKSTALHLINEILVKISDDDKLIEISKRLTQLIPYPPPGSDVVVRSRV